MSQGEKDLVRVDRRVRRSRRAIMDAFERLILSQPLDQITVSAIAREADVDRKTFYQHFGTVDGLLDAVAEERVSTLLDEVEQLCVRESCAAPDAFFDALMSRISRNLELEQGYCEHMPLELLFERLARPLMRQIVERGFVRGELDDAELEMILSFELGGLFSLYRWWLLTGRSVPLPEVTRCANALSDQGVRQFLR